MSPIRLPSSDNGSRLLVVQHGRTSAPPRVEVSVGGAPHPIRATMHRGNRWMGVLFEKPAPAESVLDVRIELEPASAAVTRVFLVDPRRSPVAKGPRALGVETTVDPRAADERSDDARLIHLAELSSIDPLRDEGLDRAAWMWWHMDVNTHPMLLPGRRMWLRWPWRVDPDEASHRVGAAVRLAEWLGQRSAERWKLGRTGADASTIREKVAQIGVDQAPERWLAPIAVVLRSVVRDWYPDILRQDVEAFAVACGAFASGAIQLGIDPAARRGPLAGVDCSEGAPDSIAVVLLAEMALAAIDCGMDPGWWGGVGRPFVGMLEVFHEAYGARDAGGHACPTSVGEYEKACAQGPWRQVDWRASASRWSALPGDPEGLGLELAQRLGGILSEPIMAPLAWARRH